ncbi:MAG TPA: DUF3500 domain-containing protein [Trebonia sp.]
MTSGDSPGSAIHGGASQGGASHDGGGHGGASHGGASQGGASQGGASHGGASHDGGGQAHAGWLAPVTAARMAAAARALLAGVAGERRSVLNPEFEDFDLGSPRRHWTYLPVTERPGLALRGLPDPERKLAHELIVASVSMDGYAKVVSVMAMEHVRRALVQAATPANAHLFDPERYCFRIFGHPGDPGDPRAAPWGWQLAGHHVSLNFTVADGYVSATPCMFGSVPASYGPLSPLEREEADGYRFVNSLTGGQRAKAVIWHRPPPDFATRVVPRIGETEVPDHVFAPEPGYRISDEERAALAYVRSGPRGVSGAALTAEQLDALTDLVALFAGRLPSEVAAAELRRVEAAGAENLWFAWAGGTRPGERHYYRVQGPGLLIEHDNTQGGGNHVHSVWRVPGGDFGDDLLAAHYRDTPH